MDPALTAALLAAVFTALGAFVGYWLGVDRTERQAATREDHLLAELDAAVDLIAALPKHPSARHLKAVR